MLYIFLNNKLITADTVLPLLVELRRRQPQLDMQFICFEPKTEAAIRENVVVFDAMSELGPLRMLGRRSTGPGAFFAHRGGMFIRMVLMALRACMGRAAFLHFKALNEWPLRLLALVARGRTFYMQPSNLVHSATERRVDEINKPRRRSKIVPAAGHLVGFDNDWLPLSDPRLERAEIHVLPSPNRLRIWHEHVDAVTQRYLSEVYADSAIPEQIAAYILSSMDRAPLLADPDSFKPMFEETLQLLYRANPGLSVLIKPHPATKPGIRQFQNEVVARQQASGQDVRIVHLHPMVLARSANFFIGNMFSSTFSNAAVMGVPTIEYTSYSNETLGESGGQSIRPDLVSHFIDRDQGVLQALLTQVQGWGPRLNAPDLVGSEPSLEHWITTVSRLAGKPLPVHSSMNTNALPGAPR